MNYVLGVVELTGVTFPGAHLTGEREGGRGAEQEERVQETWGSRGTEAESPERGKSNSGHPAPAQGKGQKAPAVLVWLVQ